MKKCAPHTSFFLCLVIVFTNQLFSMESSQPEMASSSSAMPSEFPEYLPDTTLRTNYSHIKSLDYCNHDGKIIIQTSQGIDMHDLQKNKTKAVMHKLVGSAIAYAAEPQIFASCRTAKKYEKSAKLKVKSLDTDQAPLNDTDLNDDFVIKGPAQLSPKGDLLVYCSNNNMGTLDPYFIGKPYCDHHEYCHGNDNCWLCRDAALRHTHPMASTWHGAIRAMALNKKSGTYQHDSYLDSCWYKNYDVTHIKISPSAEKVACCSASSPNAITLYYTASFIWFKRMFNSPSLKNLIPKFSWTHELNGHTEEITSLDFSSNSEMLASGSRDKTIRLWKQNPSTYEFEPAQVLEGHTEAVNTVRFSPVSMLLASGSDDATIRTWGLKQPENTYQLVQIIPGNEHPVHALAFSSDETKIASSSKNKICIFKQLDVPAEPAEIGKKRRAQADKEVEQQAKHPKTAEQTASSTH